jgi:hypothetical protein
MFQSEGKSMNQSWKESGTSLSFVEWLHREQLKGVVPPKNVANDTLQSIQKSIDPNKKMTDQPKQQKAEIFGLNPLIVYGALILVSGAYFYSKVKK